MENRLKKPLVALFLIALTATAIYSNAFSVPFQFDDALNIVENRRIENLANFLDFSSSRYVGFLSFALNYHFGGLNVFGYHLINLLIHITNGFLVYILVLFLFRISSSEKNRGSWLAVATALLFTAHPIQTQAVTYIIQRFASLATLFYLLAVVSYLKWRLVPSDQRFQLSWYTIALIATALGIKTKEFVFTLPFMILFVEVLFFSKRKWLYLIPFFLTLIIIPVSRIDVLGGEEVPLFSGTVDVSRWDYFFTQFRVIMTYIRLLFWPTNQTLDYDYPIYHTLLHPAVFLSLFFLCVLFVSAVFLLRPKYKLGFQLKLTAFGILWFFLTLSAESSIIPIKDVIFEHRIYLPSVGVFLAISCLANWGWQRWKKTRIPLVICFFIIIGVLSITTYQRNFVWGSAVSLWQDVIKKAPNKARGHYNLGRSYDAQGHVKEAIQEYKIALQLKPDYAMAHYNLGIIYAAQGHIAEAIWEYQAALQLRPDYAMAHYNLGLVYKGQGRIEEAILEYQKAIKLNPNHAKAHNNLGNAYSVRGYFEQAIQEYHKALQLQPDYADVHYNLGNIYAAQGRWKDAIKEYQATLKLQPNDAEARTKLENAYHQHGN